LDVETPICYDPVASSIPEEAPMPIDNAGIAAMLNRLADLLEDEDANTFRVRAYRKAAQLVDGMSRSIADMVAAGEDLSQLPGIGDALVKKLEEMVETGRLSALEQLEQHGEQGEPGTSPDAQEKDAT